MPRTIEAAEAKVAELEAKLAARDDEEAELLSIAAMYGQKRGMDGLRELKAENERLRAALSSIAAEPGKMIWGEDYEVREAMQHMEDAAYTALAALDKGDD